ncbi:phage tail spike protein [Jeotgalibaca porci]|uniref:phage tail spike protein n=1 Tax=Jeotgalibaca porci TaxID=1868793 RepID=UPI00359FFDB2
MYRGTWHTSFQDKGTVLHDPYTDGLKIEGTIAKEINKVDNFTFKMYDQGVAEQIMPIKDYIRVYNTKTQEYDFEGRIFNISKGTDQKGAPYFEFVCEGLLGFLHDVGIGNGRAKKTLKEHLLYFLDVYNRLVQSDEEKVIQAGNLTYSQINRQLTFEWFPEDSAFEIIVNRLISENGGELQLRREGENLYLDWLDNIGHISATPIHTGHNLLKDEKSSDFSDYGTVYVPLGAKTGESLNRLTIRDVNNGSEYLYDAGRPTFGRLMKWLVYDDVDDPAELKRLAQEDLDSQKFSKDQYTVSALDLSLNGLDIEGFKLGNGYVLTDDILQIKNEILRVVKINIDINEPQLSSITIGDKYTDLSEFQNDRARLADYRQRQTERKFDDVEIYQVRQDGLIETNKNNIGTNSHNINVNKERIDAIVEWRDGFIERYNDLVGIVNDLVANQTPTSGGGGGGTDSSGYANNRVFPVDYNLPGINFWTRATQPDMSYGPRWGSLHSGWDIGSNGNAGYGIYATTDGVVRKSEMMSGGIGNAIYIEHTSDSYWSNYMHLASRSVSVGQTVKAGQRIGTMGNTGGDYAIHLHYELSPNGSFHSGGNTINPQSYLGITGDNKTSLPRPV